MAEPCTMPVGDGLHCGAPLAVEYESPVTVCDLDGIGKGMMQRVVCAVGHHYDKLEELTANDIARLLYG